MNEKLTRYLELRNKLRALNYASYMISWDSETEAPRGCFEDRSKQIGVLAQMNYDIALSKEMIDLVEALYQDKASLDSVMQVEITKAYKDLQKKKKIPTEEMVHFEMLLSKAGSIWTIAKQKNAFELFAPILEEIVLFMQKYVGYLKNDSQQGYDILLDEYEEGFSTKEYDTFFAAIKQEIVPLVGEIVAKKYLYPTAFAQQCYPIASQKEFTNRIMEIMGFDRHRGLTKESEHPFTSGYGTTDVRWTNHYYETNFISSIFSAIHELGHAMYEQQCDPKLDDTLVGGGTSMAFHESQSRFYENIIGRSLPFWNTHYATLQSLFPDQLKNITVDDFYHFVNKVDQSLIRTEADELTYPLHIMIRYDIEQQLIDGSLKVSELPQMWNKLYKAYLGVDVPTDKEGVLQDVHWAGGSFGYFPTYALGSAYAAQIYYQMCKEIDVDGAIASGNLKAINLWLKAKIHQYGQTKKPKELLKMITGEDFNPKYYTNYLKEKYRKLYHL